MKTSDGEATHDTTLTTDEIAAWIARHGIDQAGPDAVEWIQTHISHVFLVGDRVYKLRKGVTLPFLDFGTREARNEDCVREVVLNRRLAPDVYLGIVSFRLHDGSLEVGSPGGIPDGSPGRGELDPELEHAVLMRRLPEGRDALAMLEADRLTPEQLERVALRLARFHDQVGLGEPAPFSREAWHERNAAPVLDCVETLEACDLLDAKHLEHLRGAVVESIESLAPAFEERRLAGRAIDAHGDLHLDHVWFETDDADPLLVDCLEFDAELRRIDRGSEVAFLAMDLAYRGRNDLAEIFLSAYARESDDYDLYRVVDYYAAYRALVRAKVAALAAGQESVAPAQQNAARESALRHIELAERLLGARDAGIERGDRGQGALVLTCGTVGSGKSSVARALAREEGGVLLSSDRLRKRLSGLAVTDHREQTVDGGLYAPERREAVYEAMLGRADLICGSGRTAILDASFTRRADRDRARAWAEERDIAPRLIEVRCDPQVALERLAARERAGGDPSDAGPDFLATSIDRFEPPEEWPAERREVVRTDD